jgi:hypothetical protein
MRVILSIKRLKLNDCTNVGVFQRFNIVTIMFLLKLEFSDDEYKHKILRPNFPPRYGSSSAVTLPFMEDGLGWGHTSAQNASVVTHFVKMWQLYP